MEGKFSGLLTTVAFVTATQMMDRHRRSSPQPSPSRLRPHSALRIHIRSCVRRDGSRSWYRLEVWTAQCRSHGDLRTTCSRTSNWMPISSTKRRSATTLTLGRGTSSSLGAPVASTYVDAWKRAGRPSPSRRRKAAHQCCSSRERL